MFYGRLARRKMNRTYAKNGDSNDKSAEIN